MDVAGVRRPVGLLSKAVVGEREEDTGPGCVRRTRGIHTVQLSHVGARKQRLRPESLALSSDHLARLTLQSALDGLLDPSRPRLLLRIC